MHSTYNRLKLSKLILSSVTFLMNNDIFSKNVTFNPKCHLSLFAKYVTLFKECHKYRKLSLSDIIVWKWHFDFQTDIFYDFIPWKQPKKKSISHVFRQSDIFRFSRAVNREITSKDWPWMYAARVYCRWLRCCFALSSR